MEALHEKARAYKERMAALKASSTAPKSAVTPPPPSSHGDFQRVAPSDVTGARYLKPSSLCKGSIKAL